MTQAVETDSPDEIEPHGKKPSGPHPLTRRSVWLPLAIVFVILNIPFVHFMLRGAASVTTTIPFKDDYSRADLGNNYWSSGGLWRIEDGWVYSPGVKNNPLWLRAKLPHDVVVEFDVKSDSTSGDVKCEIFGNGRDHSSGYVLVMGGWNNTISTIARLDEHGSDREATDTLIPGTQRKKWANKRVEKDRVYHWKVVRDGKLLSWYVDGDLFISYDDANPLYGSGNDRFGFGTWTTDAYFDNLSITPLH